MRLNFHSDKPIFLQITEQIEDAIFTGAFTEESQVPSTTEISATFQINPATVLKGINVLVDEGILYKKRGVGVFISKGAREAIRVKRQEKFYESYIQSMVTEAQKLGLTEQEILRMVERSFKA